MAEKNAEQVADELVSDENQTMVETVAESTNFAQWTVEELKIKLRSLKLPTSGRKAVLVERVKAAMQGDEDQEEECDESDQEEACVEQAKSEFEYPIDSAKQFHLGKARLKFGDVQDTIQSFSGDEGENVQRWVDTFEDTAEMSNWYDIEKIINAKRKLTGSAKLWAQFESQAKTWGQFKADLIKEFKQTVNSKQVHKQLATARKQEDESMQAFVYRMLQIASHIEMEVESVIQYIVDGIQDDERNKSILYGAESIKELRKKLQLYETFKKNSDKNKKENTAGNEVVKKVVKNQSLQKRCFNCGSKNHLSVNCPDKASGPKCFKCGAYGHIAPKCSKAGKNLESTKQDRVRVDMLNSNDKKTYKVVNICGKDVTAVLDAGSDLHLIRSSLYLKLGAPELKPSNVLFDSVGVVGKSTLGNFETQLVIDGLTFNFVFEVIPDYYVRHDLIIGGELSDYAEVKLRHRQAILSEINTEWMPKEGVYQEILNINVLDEPEEDNRIDISHVNNPEMKQKLANLVQSYEPNKSKETGVELRIVLKDDIPVHQHPRRLSYAQREVANKIIADWEESGVVRPSISEYASPIVLVEKKNNKHRLCVDYRELNKKVFRDRNPLPLIEDQVDKLQDAIVYSTIDLKDSFHHVPVEENSVRYTSFVVPDGQWEFCKMPFGFANSPAVFQRHIRVVFKDLISKGVVSAYLDDLIITAKNESEALEKLEVVLKTASDYGLIINWGKCNLLVTSVEYLGYVIEAGCYFPSNRKTMAVAKFPTPSTAKQVQSFLGLAGYFRKFIQQFSVRARPLSNLLRGDAKFHFGQEQEAAFEDLKSAIANKPVLRLYRVDAETELHTDACQGGLGAILLQKNSDDGLFHPIYYASWKTTVGEEKYTSFELEFLAVIKAVKKFRVYLLGIHFKIVTDCKAFALTLKKKKDSCLRVSHWVVLLEQFNYTIEHRPGTAMRHVDALSRNPVSVMCTSLNNETLIAKLQKAQKEDGSLNEFFEIAKEGKTAEFELKGNDVLYRTKEGVEQLVIPKSMQYEVIRQAHERGHFGCKKTEYLLLQEFWFPKMHSKVQKFILNCVKCILAERKSGKAEGWYHPIGKGETPLDTYHIDFLGPIPSTKKSYNHLYVVVDAFSKFTWIYPTKSVSADDAINCLKRQATIFGNPRCIVSDRGSAFTSHAFQEYCKEENICHSRITTGVPRGNGQVERLNRIIIAVLTKLSVDKPMEWYKHLGAVQQMLNSTYQRSIGKTPFELLVGVKMKVKEDFELRTMINEEMVECFEKNRQELREEAKKNLLKIQEENRKTYNKKRKSPRLYCVGDLVAIQRTQFGTGLKLAPKFLGSYKVTSVRRNHRYLVEKIGDHEGPCSTSTSADLMKPWPDSELDEEEFSENISEDA